MIGHVCNSARVPTNIMYAKPNSGIYLIENTLNGRVYVGSAANFNARRLQHIGSLRSNTHYNRFLQRAWNKYGESAFRFRLILFCNKASLLQWEQIAIDGHKSMLGRKALYNIGMVAGSGFGNRHSSESLARIRSYRHTPEAKAAMSQKRRGRKFSEEHKAAISQAKRRYKFSEEHKRQLSVAHKAPTYKGLNHPRDSAGRFC